MVRLTAATVPPIVDTSVASDSEVCALVTWVWAEAMLASSDAICADEALLVWSVASWAWSLARLAWASANDAESDESSMVASAWPSLTTCPTLTSTAVTRPDTPKLRLAWLAGSMVPVEETVLVMVPVETVWTVVVVEMSGAALELLVANQVPTPAATTITTIAPKMVPLLANHFLPVGLTCSSLGPLDQLCARRPPTGGALRPPTRSGTPSNRPNIEASEQSPVKLLRMNRQRNPWSTPLHRPHGAAPGPRRWRAGQPGGPSFSTCCLAPGANTLRRSLSASRMSGVTTCKRGVDVGRHERRLLRRRNLREVDDDTRTGRHGPLMNDRVLEPELGRGQDLCQQEQYGCSGDGDP